MIYRAINGLIRHAIEADLITNDDIFVVRNQLMDILKLTDWDDKEPLTGNIEELLEPLIDYAVKAGIIEDTSVQRDLFDTRVMGVFTPMPREVNATFQRKYSASPSAATEWYYAFSKSLNYVRAERIAKDLKWTYESEYGTLDITINRSKPEKEPRDIAAAKLQKKSAYPQCQLCVENMGFAGHQTHPARQNLRPVKLNINSQDWFMQWNTGTCNGNMDSDAYLHTQISRAICLAAYEKPLTVEEISISTGIPTMYIEDELPRLEYGDAICKVGNKYVTNFIIFRLKDRKQTEDVSALVVSMLADKFEVILREAENKISALDFYGNDFGIGRLGYIVVPYLLRHKISDVKNNRLKLENGPYPPRKDGGYGWFIVEETVDESENCAEYNSGCNVAGDDSGSEYKVPSHIYYYWISKYFDYNIYHNKGMRWMCANGIPQNSVNGVVSKEALSEEDAAHLIETNLLIKSEAGFSLNFPHFTAEQFGKFVSLFEMTDKKLNDLLAEWIVTVRNNFENFVPKHLHDQINQWVSCYLHQIIGYTTDELIRRGILRKPDNEKPLTDGVFIVEGKYINP